MTIDNLSSLFNPSITKVSAKPEDLMRLAMPAWTTNGFWAMATKIEPGFIKKQRDLKTPEDTTNLHKELQNILSGWEKAKNNELEIKNNFRLAGGTPCVMLKNGKYVTWVNAYFISLFDKTPFKGYKFYQEAKDKPVFVEYDGYVSGLIMPVKME